MLLSTLLINFFLIYKSDKIFTTDKCMHVQEKLRKRIKKGLIRYIHMYTYKKDKARSI